MFIPTAIALMEGEGFHVETYPAGLLENELCEKIKMCRCWYSLEDPSDGKSIGECDRLDGDWRLLHWDDPNQPGRGTRRGVSCFQCSVQHNAVRFVELTIAEIIMLIRGIPDKSAKCT